MKKSLRRKLLLSGLAMGVAALSLSATTYAWFTANTTVDTTTATATVAQNNSLYIKNPEKDTAWGTTATLGYTPTMNPVHWDGTKFVNIEGQPVSADGNYLTFTLAFKTDLPNQDVVLNNVIISDNTTSNFILKADAGTDATAKLGQTVVGDPLNSLRFLISNHANPVSYNKDVASVYDGLTYYNNMMGVSLSRPTSYTPATADNQTINQFLSAAANQRVIFVNTGSTGEVEVQISMYLEGWDKDNFDAICSTKFTIKFDFALAE